MLDDGDWRLLRVTDGGGKVWKDFTYATANGTTAEGGTDWRAGKLVQARRHNWLPGGQGGEIDRVVTEQFVYGGPGGRVSEKRLRGQDAGAAGAVSFVQGFDYDLLGDLASEIYPLCVSPRCERYGPPRVVEYQRSAGRLTAVPTWVDSITYNVNGWMDRVNFFNRNYQIQTQDPNAMERPARFQYDGGPLPSIDSGTFTYDGAGNITGIGADRYAYDLVSRIKEADLVSVGATQSYTYDSFNNLTSITTTEASGTDVRTVGVDKTTNRLTGAAYDAAGSVTSLLSITSLERDPFHKVAAMTGTGVNRQYLFTADDYRVAVVDELADEETWSLRGLHDKVLRQYAKTADGWIWDGDWIYRDGLLTASTRYAEMRFYLLDHLGSPRIVADPIGQLVTEYRSFPFGELASPLPENDPERNFRFTGHERDTHCTGCSPERQDDLDYMLARYYSPWVGRFLGVDPLPLLDLATKDPQRWNLYSYVANNPMSRTDPTGEFLVVLHANQTGEGQEELDLLRSTLQSVGAGAAASALQLEEINGEVQITSGDTDLTKSSNPVAQLIGEILNSDQKVVFGVVQSNLLGYNSLSQFSGAYTNSAAGGGGQGTHVEVRINLETIGRVLLEGRLTTGSMAGARVAFSPSPEAVTAHEFGHVLGTLRNPANRLGRFVNTDRQALQY